VLVDSASQRTARSRSPRGTGAVVQKEWLARRQKQFAVEQAAHDWVLCLDADEPVSPELAASIEPRGRPVSPV